MSNVALDEAVKEAVKTEEPVKTEETKVETKEETKAEEVKEPQVDPEVQEALQLYRALKDPTIGKAVVQELANRAGLSVAAGTTTVKEAKKAITDLLKENVPTEYHFLVDGLAKGIEAAINQRVEEKTAPIQAESRQALERMVEKEVDAELESFYGPNGRHKDAKDFREEIDKLSTKMPWAGPDSMPMAEYLDNLYAIVSRDSAEGKTVEKVVNRINKNAKEVRETSTVASPTEVKTGSKLPNLDESIKAAFRNERLI